MPNESQYGYGPNSANIQLPGLGGRHLGGPVRAGETSVGTRILAGLPVPDGESTDWDSPGEVVANVLNWGIDGESQSGRTEGAVKAVSVGSLGLVGLALVFGGVLLSQGKL